MNLSDYESLIHSAVRSLENKYGEDAPEEEITEMALITLYTHQEIESYLAKKLGTISIIKMVDKIAADIAWIYLA